VLGDNFKEERQKRSAGVVPRHLVAAAATLKSVKDGLREIRARAA